MTVEVLPRQIGRYQILAQAGRGSMARVYAARDPNTERRVALKVLVPPPESTPESEADSRNRFLLEARAAGRLQHAGIVLVYDADTDAATGRPYLAMEWVEGRTLSALLRERGPLPWREALAIATAVARALDHAHGRGVVHRDVKPANILVGDDGRVKVSDFGIAKFATESHTLAGQVVGTPNYMSPEQVRGGALDGRSDLFSLGAVLYELLTGAPPFKADSIAGITYRIAHVDPRPAAELVPGLPPELDELLLQLLDKDPTRRPGTGVELAERFDRLAGLEGAGGAGDTAERPLAPTRSAAHPPLLALGLGAALLVLLVALGLRLTNGGEPPALAGGPAVAEPVAAVAPVAALPAAAASATLELRHNNRLGSATLTVWVDGQRVWSAPMRAGENVLRRLEGEEVQVSLPVAPGRRSIEVRIDGHSTRAAARALAQAEFRAGQSRQLRVVLRPFQSKLGLSWER